MIFGCVRGRGRRILALAGIFTVTASLAVATSSPADAARRKKSRGGYNPPFAEMVVDVKTGRTLSATNEDALRYPASITKVMTLYLLFEHLERGAVRLDTPLSVSANAARQAPSKLGLKPGSTIEVEDAIKALVTKSANDVAVVVAENIGGSEPSFAEMMTRKARELGMSRTVFRNASGLPNKEQVTTARDLTILARAIQERFPKYYGYFETRSFTYAGKTHKNHNKLLGRIEGVDGIKTGFTNASGFNLMTNVKTDDRHVVAVVLGGRSGASRDQIMASLIQTHLPRAYAGARTAPAVAARPTVVAQAGEPMRLQDNGVETTGSAVAATTTTPTARKPLDLNALRPVVASAAGASSTTTPTSPLRLKEGPQALPSSVQAYAPVQSQTRATAAPAQLAPAASAKSEERLPAGRIAVAKAEPAEAKREAARPVASAWVIQIGATDDEDKAKSILENAKSRSGRVLSGASPFTEKVTRGGTTLYRARFSGFDEAEEAQKACKALKRTGFACFATRG
jgi:D-alanyl-D-alanine carboxypeptidase